METAAKISEWLESLPYGSSVGVDEGGLCLRAVVGGEVIAAYYEIGGLPEELEERWQAEYFRRLRNNPKPNNTDEN